MGYDTVQQFFTDLTNPVDIYASLRPLALLCFFSGISPFRMVGSSGNRRLVVTIFGVANIVVHLALFCTCYAQRVIHKQSLLSHLFNSKVSRFGENIQIITSFMAIGFTLVLCFLKRSKLRNLLHLLSQIDNKLIELGAKINYKNISRLVWILLFMQWTVKFTFIGATFFLMRSMEKQPDYFEWIFFFLPFAIVLALKAKYVCVMRLIKNRLCYINLTLNNLQVNAKQLIRTPLRGSMDQINVNKICGITCDIEKLNGIGDVKRGTYDIIAELCRVHEDLCDACYLAEQYFSHQMLTMVTVEFAVSLFNVYFMFDVAYNNNHIPDVDTTEFFAYFIFYTMISTGTLYGLLRSAEAVTSEVRSSKITRIRHIRFFVSCEII